MPIEIFEFNNTHTFHRKALLDAVKSINFDSHENKNILLIISTKNVLKALPFTIFSKKKTVLYFTGFGRLFTDFGLMGRVLFFLLIKIYKSTTLAAIIVENDDDKNFINDNFHVPVFMTLGSGLSTEKFDFRSKRSMKDTIVFGYFSRFHKSKGADIILDIAKSLPPGRKLKIAGWNVGWKNYSRSFSHLSQSNEDISFLGKIETREEVSEFFNGIDILLAPSRREGGNIVLQEAIWHKTPFITSDVPGSRTLGELCSCPLLKNHEFAQYVLNSSTEDLLSLKITEPQRLLEPFLEENVNKQFLKIFKTIMLMV